ncbi:MAG TPA: exodeoxyribonuclease VII large subunit [Candidatus Limnocylindria bacterium]|nr:exodeoxyribonuclease VII large subunit [Candidatus Limnocylindria bacterium]
MALSTAPDAILTVTTLTRLIKEKFETGFAPVWVRGEISNLRRPSSGHLYFMLKDRHQAVLPCVLWRTTALRLGFVPKDGLEVEAYGRVTIYEAGGQYQLMTEHLRPGGLGALLLAYEELKRKLQAEGLFDTDRKQPLPLYPRRVGVVTSLVGAAVRDVIKVLRARWPGIGVVVAPVRVQGEGSAGEIAAAIRRFNRYGEVDVLIVGRGGGSLEDLWSFNEEIVVRAIAASRIPTICAVGHEVDQTLADLAADVRAATPSNAAELAVRDGTETRRHVGVLAGRARRALGHSVRDRRRRLQRLIERYGFRRTRDVIDRWRQRVDELGERMRAGVETRLRDARARLEATRMRYGLREWPRQLASRRERGAGVAARLARAVADLVRVRRQTLAGCADRLRALSPRLVLERGYCLARGADGRLLRVAAELALGERITVEFMRGEVDARVEAVRPGDDDDA